MQFSPLSCHFSLLSKYSVRHPVLIRFSEGAQASSGARPAFSSTDTGYLPGDKTAGAWISELHVRNCQMLSTTGAKTPQVGQVLWWTSVTVNADKVEAEGEANYRMYLLIEQMSRSFPAEASLLCDKCAVLRATMNQPSYFDVHTVNVILFIIYTKKWTNIYMY